MPMPKRTSVEDYFDKLDARTSGRTSSSCAS